MISRITKNCLKVLRQSYSTKTVGSGFDFKMYLQSEGKEISFWHDIPLKNNTNTFNAVIEIPRFHLAKYEMSKTISRNPIVQDTRKNRFTKEKELRYYAQFPYFNYGFFPQTWESTVHPQFDGYQGDDDPLDIIEVGSKKYKKEIGEIIEVNVLGAFCVLDQGEIDWKIICLNTEEAKKVTSFDQLEKQTPGVTRNILNWFKYIKTFDGKKENKVLFDDKIFDKTKAIEVIEEAHIFWQELVKKKDQKVDLTEKRKEFLIQ